MIHSMGWKPSLPDGRDLRFQARYMSPLPEEVDLRLEMPPVYSQGNLNSCTGNAGATLWQHSRKKLDLPDIDPARLYLYYNTRILEKSVNFDGGATLRNTLKAMVQFGMCEESLHPYEETSWKKSPNKLAYKSGQHHKVTSYFGVTQTLQSIQACLAEGFCVIFGFAVYESLENPAVVSTGIVPMPNLNEKVLGGHAVLCCGFKNQNQEFIVRNSWGDVWGDKGYCFMPYDFVLNPSIATDMWTIRATT